MTLQDKTSIQVVFSFRVCSWLNRRKSPQRFLVLEKPQEIGPDLRLKRLINYESSSFQNAEIFQYGEVGDLQELTVHHKLTVVSAESKSFSLRKKVRSVHIAVTSQYICKGISLASGSFMSESCIKQIT